MTSTIYMCGTVSSVNWSPRFGIRTANKSLTSYKQSNCVVLTNFPYLFLMEYIKLFFAFLLTILAVRSLARHKPGSLGLKVGTVFTCIIAAELAGATYLALSVIKPYCN